MKKIISLLLSLTLILSFTACGTKAQAGWKEQYDLGIRYVNEAKYEEAILAFNKALEIDPKQAPVYIALAEAYVQQGEYTTAREILHQGIENAGDTTDILDALTKLEQGTVDIQPSGGIIQPSQDMPAYVKTEKSENPDGSYSIIFFDKKGMAVRFEHYFADGTPVEFSNITYDYYPDGTPKAKFRLSWSPDFPGEYYPRITAYNPDGSTKWYSWYSPLVLNAEFVYIPETDSYGIMATEDFHSSTGNLTSYLIEFDDNGMLQKETYYESDGSTDYYVISQCDDNGNVIRSDYYQPDGTPEKYYIYTYGDDGSFVDSAEYYY